MSLMSREPASEALAVRAVRLETAARLVDSHPSTLRGMIRDGRLPATKVGRGWHIHLRDLDALLAVDPALAPAQNKTKRLGKVRWAL